MLLIYVAFAKPFVYARIAKTKYFTLLFVVANLFTLIWATLRSSEIFMPNYLGQEDIDVLRTISLALLLLLLMLMLTIYVLIMYHKIKLLRRPTNCANPDQWKTVKYFIIYTTFPNIFLLLSLPGEFCMCKFITPSIGLQPCGFCEYVIMYSTSSLEFIRNFLSSFTILIVFREYREAILRTFAMFRRKSNHVLDITFGSSRYIT
ncbi:hypothetical protein QR680_006240 [Steinernema hermaphroditum]|uniref:Uncharacterized protein n=1 Tax=Steinernema hermaphroditum TaxID=289476 RepID=A0AA39LWS9_9BILA|nr:hypothetical protein QR680_006240 [Steinernema hermaphroditum]